MNLRALVDEFNTNLANQLPWLTNCYGIAQAIQNAGDTGRDAVFPAWLNDAGEYTDMRPSDVRGNYSFILTSDPTEISDAGRNSFKYIKSPASLVAWLNIAELGASAEEVQAEVLRVINRNTRLKNGTFTAQKLYTKGANIYKGFSLKEEDSQYLMYPFAGFRIEGFFQYKETCI